MKFIYEEQFRLWEDGEPDQSEQPAEYGDFYYVFRQAHERGRIDHDQERLQHHAFTSTGQFCIKSLAAGDNSLIDIQHMVVGGGAAGGGGGSYGNDKSECGGGGGGGQYASGKNTIPHSVACYTVTIGSGGAGNTYNGANTGRGGNGGPSSVIGTGVYIPAIGGGGGGAIYYGGDFGGVSGACGGGGGGKQNATWLSNGGVGTVHFDGGKGWWALAEAEHGRWVITIRIDWWLCWRKPGNSLYGGQYGTGGGGAGSTGGSAYNLGGDGGRMPGGGASAASQYGCGGGGGGETPRAALA